MKAPCAYPLLKEAFSLSILTGLRKSDIFSLKAADLIKRDGIYYIKKTCVKTQQELIIPLSDEAEACLERSTGCRLAELDREKETPLFSALPSSRLNEKLRTWLKEAGITDKHITFHCSSHNKFFYLLNISELNILKNVTANDLETSYILFLSQLCNIQRTL
ncbi:tyrosine-type recombinase/integrase [Segatella copri]|uniref:tyrosine-type recombinase/integrase n=1 Tax=Segatella copri TaxID=165179 RepID=UPI00294AA3B5|nr:tyrosine-type recombinase/integrase [Segatella copri]